MRSTPFAIAAILAFTPAAFAQSQSSDSQTLHALLTEVRELREELRLSLTKVQEAQIVIARLQLEETAVEHASQRLDDARSKLTEVQARETHISANITRLQDTLSDPENAAVQKPQLEGALDDLRSELESAKNEESHRQTAEIDAEQQLRTEQGKRDTLQAQLDEIVKGLNAAAEAGSTPH